MCFIPGPQLCATSLNASIPDEVARGIPLAGTSSCGHKRRTRKKQQLLPLRFLVATIATHRTSAVLATENPILCADIDFSLWSYTETVPQCFSRKQRCCILHSHCSHNHLQVKVLPHHTNPERLEAVTVSSNMQTSTQNPQK